MNGGKPKVAVLEDFVGGGMVGRADPKTLDTKEKRE